jgi:hypothetical protein
VRPMTFITMASLTGVSCSRLATLTCEIAQLLQQATNTPQAAKGGSKGAGGCDAQAGHTARCTVGP